MTRVSYKTFSSKKTCSLIKTDTIFSGHFCKAFSLRAWLSFRLIFCLFQPSVAYKKGLHHKNASRTCQKSKITLHQNASYKTLHLRCLTGFWVCLYTLEDNRIIWNKQLKTINVFQFPRLCKNPKCWHKH